MRSQVSTLPFYKRINTIAIYIKKNSYENEKNGMRMKCANLIELYVTWYVYFGTFNPYPIRKTN